MSAADAVPTRRETQLAYGGATLATLVWVGCVLPAAHLLDPGVPDDLAAPLARGPALLIPALLLLVTGPVAVVITRGAAGLRTLLASGVVVVSAAAGAGILAARTGDRVAVVAGVLLLLTAALAIRDVVLELRAVPAAADGAVRAPTRRVGGPRLALALLALLVPASLLAQPPFERASLLAPFAYVTLSTLGERLARGRLALRFTASGLFTLVAAHVLVALRFLVVEATPAAGALRPAGIVTFALAGAVLLANAAWAVSCALAVRAGRAGPA